MEAILRIGLVGIGAWLFFGVVWLKLAWEAEEGDDGSDFYLHGVKYLDLAAAGLKK